MGRIISFFLPKEHKFFELFARQSETVLNASKDFHVFLKKYNSLNQQKREQIVSRIRKLEMEGDTQSKEIIELLHQSLVTPFDREDIHALTVLLDDILDSIDENATKMNLYKINTLPPAMEKQADTMLEMVETINLTMNSMRSMQEAKKNCAQIYSLEHKGDTLYEEALSDLFSTEDGRQVLEVIKFKELYEEMEKTFDKGKELADTIQAIVVKHG